MFPAGIRAVIAAGAGVYADKVGVLDQVGLRRVIVRLAGLCVAGIGVMAVLLALSGRSTAPLLCLALALPAIAWALRLHARAQITYCESIAFVAFCDAVILIGLFVVTGIEVGFLKLAWLIAVSGYVYGFHGRVAMAAQMAVTAVGLGIVIVSSLQRGDAEVPVLAATSLTFVVMNAATAMVIDVGTRRFGSSADRAQQLARLDELTGLLNRRGLDQACDGRSGPVAVAVVDLDGFKRLNDTGGHAAGDEALRRVARCLLAAAGPGALVARLGGDEFALVVDPVPDLEATVHAALVPESIGASVGVAHGDLSGVATLDGLLAAADTAMYAAKRAAGRRPLRG